MKQSSPAAVDAALAAWVSTLCGSAPLIETEGRFPEGGAYYRVAVAAQVPANSEEEARAVLQKYQGAMTSPTKEQTENWFYAMRLATASGAKSEMDEVGRMAIYVAELSRYPADVAKATFDHFTRTPHAGVSWLPTLPEMISVAERLVSSRRAVIAALSKWEPLGEARRRAARIRELLFTAAELDASSMMMKRSAPEEYEKAQRKVMELRQEARKLRSGEL